MKQSSGAAAKNMTYILQEKGRNSFTIGKLTLTMATRLLTRTLLRLKNESRLSSQASPPVLKEKLVSLSILLLQKLTHTKIPVEDNGN